MRNKISLVGAVLLTGIALFPVSCKKASNPERVIQQKLACDVAQYNVSYGGIPDPGFPVLFQKTYDAAGKTVTEIHCTFVDVESWPYFFYGPQHDLLVTKNDSSLILRNKNNLVDTSMKVLFSRDGRPVSTITSVAGNITDYFLYCDTEYFAYKGSRIFSVQTAGGQVDTVRYDSLGNVLSFAGNNYIYDYYRQATESFYITDIQRRDHGYYLLQYLGYFPEVTNTNNILSNISSTTFGEKINLVNDEFDPAGRVISFNADFIVGYNLYGGSGASTTVTYQCQ
jgi:hypothetical protein